MSKIALKSAEAGTGTFEIQAPATNTNRVLELPDEAGKVLTTGNSDPAEVFKQSNILGTVSQSDGVPTGAIIERGFNSNGSFVKYADGTQICWKLDTVASAVNTASYSIQGINVFRNEYTWTFPSAFISTTNLSITNQTRQNRIDLFTSTFFDSITTTGVNLQNVSLTSWSSFARIRVVGVAIGRWF